MTGITSALEAAAAGYEVVLVEKQAQLGGFVGTLKKRFPQEPPYTELSAEGIADKIQEVTYHPKVKVLTSAKIVKTSGQPGMFDVTIDSQGATSEVRAGAIIMATGWKPYDAGKLGHLGYGLTPDVVTNVEFERYGGGGRNQETVGRQAPRERAFHPVRRFEGQGPPALLLVGLLHGDAEARRVRPRTERGRKGLHHLQGHADARPVREILPHRPGRPHELPHQGGGQGRGEGRGRQARGDGGEHPDRRDHADPRGHGGSRRRHGAQLGGRGGDPRPRRREAQGRKGRIRFPARRGGQDGRASQGPRRNRDTQPDLPTGPGPARIALRLPGLALRLLPLRDPKDRNLRGGERAQPHGLFPLAGRRPGCCHEGHSVGGACLAGQGGPPAGRRHVLPRFLPPALHPVQALHRGMSLRLTGRGRKGHAPSRIPTAAGGAASAWAPAPSASSPSRTTRWT